jgi:uncharacterized protein
MTKKVFDRIKQAVEEAVLIARGELQPASLHYASDHTDASINTTNKRNDMKIVYLHGFGSQGHSTKSDQLRAKFGEDQVVSPDLPIDPHQVKQIIDHIVVSNRSWPLIFVGTSLGGFYAKWAAHHYDCPAVLVNPAVHPSKTLYQWLGKNRNYGTGKEFELTQSHLDELSRMEKESTGTNGALIHVFVAQDDEIIPSQDVLAALPHTAHLHVSDEGGHRYETGWPQVVDYISRTWGEPRAE